MPHAHSGDLNDAKTSRVLRISLGVTVLYIVLLVVMGIRSHSLALLSEAGHNLSDFLALLLTWVAVYVQSRPPSATKTFGYQRAGVLAAFINAASLVLIAFFIFYEAGRRLYAPSDVEPRTMMWVAACGVVMNGAIALMLLRTRRDLNIRSAFLHELGDTLSTAAVIVGGWVILETGQSWVDPALSFGIGVLVLWSSFGVIRDSLNILLEGTPRGMNVQRLAERMCSIDGVIDVHDLHVWSLGSETHALSCHIRIADLRASESEAILKAVNEAVAHDFHIHHTTIQFEHEVCEVAHGCVIPVSHAHDHTHDHA
ncbi:cation diffusion facilitator family transporter [Candidatus Koribacter versatilis Ellin345]|uniref:Cation diffusion facilitator family transporter n=1 Tax=Koribacter versatilis (strain Ellin345) TaxID=204669 RepID=Q1II24_KORVE|nr:cation diffusion facilitator family transporter [Candidatus Koribacter versatilis]ABF43476.1 cation diffusion facilitator family transporter [Candidatus Koribacter versatilis Ellin345]